MTTRSEERSRNEQDVVQRATSAALEYAEASDRMMAIVERLGDAHAKLSQSRIQRDELLLSAVTAWHALGTVDQARLRALVEMVNHPAAQKLLASIVKQHDAASGQQTDVRKAARTAANETN